MGLGVKYWAGLGLATFVILLGAEAASIRILHRKGQTSRSFLWNNSRAGGLNTAIDRPRYYVLDPTLGYTRQPPFSNYGNLQDPRAVKIGALGGSTSDEGIQPENWSSRLSEVAQKRGANVAVQSGGVGGYSSGQELLKLTRDLLPLKPQIVVSFSGVNDVNNAFIVPNHPLVHVYQLNNLRLLLGEGGGDSRLFPNIVRLLHLALYRLKRQEFKYDLGTVTDVPTFASWSRHVKLMHAIAAAEGAEYFVFLQPYLGIDHSVRGERELAEIAADHAQYLRDAREFYAGAQRSCRELSYCTDLTEIFRGQKDVWADPRHPNAAGHLKIAEAIYSRLEKDIARIGARRK